MSGLKKLIDSNAVTGIEELKTVDDGNYDVNNNDVCEGCELGKTHRKPFGKEKSKKAESALDCVHADLSGPINVEENEFEQNRYLLTIIDEKTRKKFGFLMRSKSDTTDKIIEWCNRVTVEKGKMIKEFHSDGGGEFTSTKLLDYFKEKGISVSTTVKHTPQHNGIAERANRTIFEMARSMLYHAGLPLYFWGEAVLHAVYVRNRCITSASPDGTPEEQWSGTKPSVKHIRVFGCDCYVHVPDSERTKMEPKAKKGIMLGYDETKNGYRVYDIESHKMVISRDVQFDENKFECAKELKGRRTQDDWFGSPSHQLDKEQEEESSDEEEEDDWIDIYDLPEPVQRSGDEDQTGATTATVDGPNKRGPNHANDSNKTIRTNVTQRNQKMAKQKATANNSNRPKRITRPAMRYGMVDPRDVVALLTGESEASEDEPLTYSEAMNGKESHKWKQATDDEMQSLHENKTWTLVDLPPGRKAIGSKWVFKIKRNADGSVERYKARLVAKGYDQKEGIDYNETFAPVVNGKSIRVVFTLAAMNDCEIDHLDVKTAFLNADIKEEVYMEQPEGYKEKGKQHMVCRLNKTIYGVKQAPNEWNNEINGSIVSLGFSRCVSDTCVYVRRSKTGKSMIILLFVDDLVPVYAGDDKMEWTAVKQQLMNRYKMTDKGPIRMLLGMKVERDRMKKTITLTQEAYVNKMLKVFGMEQCKPIATPMDKNKLTKQDCPQTQEEQNEMRDIPYKELVGSLLYASVTTRPDIAYAVNQVSRFMSNPGMKHWQACKRILRYLKGATKTGLVLNGADRSQPLLSAYSDADWAGDVDDRKSTTGTVMMMNGSVVSWMSKKQTTVALSTAEAEYMALGATIQEIRWIRNLLGELGVSAKEPTTVWCDNQAAIAISKNDVNHNRTKHIDIKHHFVRDAVKTEQVKIEWISTSEQVADVLTKALDKNQFARLRDDGLGMSQSTDAGVDSCNCSQTRYV